MKSLTLKQILGAILIVIGLVSGKSFAVQNPFLENAADDGSLYGLWGGFPEIPVGPMTIVFQLDIRESKVTNRVICKYNDGVDVQVDVVSHANIGPSTIAVTEAQKQSASVNGHTCEASVQPGSLDYSLDNDRLTLSANGQTLTLNRIGQK